MAVDAKQVQAVFSAVCDMADTAERAALLDRECAANQPLRERVEALLRAKDSPGSMFIDRPSVIPSSTSELTGAVIASRYKLREQIGEGGMGVVWVAEQREPVKRLVALKLIKPGMDSKSVLARFEVERQALAIMDHPNIAKVLDGGTTELGRPFFVMELVRGVPITDYCDQHHLTPKQRLKLFISVCHAVQHAHQKGIIHRDLKPSNVLVTEHDASPVIKVIDFGVAKALGQEFTDKTSFTGLAHMVGTPQYMSPEQAGQGGRDIDTRSDVYSLGVLLYELLTGTTPFTKERFKQAAYDEIRRIIREEDPPKPSTRLSESKDSLPSISAQRQTEPGQLTKLLRNELDWIVMKALDKDRDRRFETANGLALDVHRFLNDEPVMACPPSQSYLVRKFLSRYRGPVAAAALVVVTLLTGIAGTTWGLVRADRARRAEIDRAEGESQAKSAAQMAAADARNAQELAEKRESETRAVLQFVESKILAAARPEGQGGGLGRDVSMRKAVEFAVPFVDKNFAGQPLIEARLRMTLGTSFWYLGEATSSAQQNERARALYTQHLGLDDPDTLRSMSNLAISYDLLGRYADALNLREETLLRRKARLGHNHPDTVASMNNLAISYETHGRNAEALQLRQETLALDKSMLGPDHPDTLRSMSNLANSFATVGRYDDARRLQEEVVILRKSILGSDHPDTLLTMSNLGSSYASLDRNEEALKIREETLARQRTALGETHPHTLLSMNNLAVSLAAVGRHAEALKLREGTLATRRSIHGADHPDTLRSMYSLALSLADLGRLQEALKLHEETLVLRKAKLAPEHPETLRSMREIAKCLMKLNRGADAVPVIDDCVARAAKQPGDPALVPSLIRLRLQHFANVKDVVGCRTTAEMWEKLGRTDADSLYKTACYRAVTTGVILSADQSQDAAKRSDAEATRAMEWLRKAVAAGLKDVAGIKSDNDLAALRGREDFKQLIKQLETKSK